EVRLSKERELMRLITEAIQSVFVEQTLIPDALENLNSRRAKVEEQPEVKSGSKSTNLYYDKVSQDFFVDKIQVHEEYSIPQENVVSSEELRTASIFEEVVVEEKQPIGSSKIVEEKQPFPDLEYLAQLHATYLLCQAQD